MSYSELESEGARDAARLDWFQANTSIKRELEFTDVVDHYCLTMTGANGEVLAFWRGNSLRQCIDAAMAQSETEGKQ